MITPGEDEAAPLRTGLLSGSKKKSGGFLAAAKQIQAQQKISRAAKAWQGSTKFGRGVKDRPLHHTRKARDAPTFRVSC